MFRSFIKDHRGQALVEFALILPVLLLLLLGIMEAGRLFAGYVELQNAAREGVRWEAVNDSGDENQIYTVVKGRYVLVNEAEVTKEIKPNENSGEYCSISLNWKVDPLTPITAFLANNVSKKIEMPPVKMVMRKE